VSALVETGLAKSNGDARRSIKEGGINVNNVRVTDAESVIDGNHLLDGKFVVLRKGKKNYHLIKAM